MSFALMFNQVLCFPLFSCIFPMCTGSRAINVDFLVTFKKCNNLNVNSWKIPIYKKKIAYSVMIILAVKRQKTYTVAPPFKACFHFSCVNISYACASCLCYCVLLTMITFFWSLSLLQDLKHRTKLEGMVAAREGNLSLLLILTYCLFKSLSSRILNFSLCLQCLSHITYKFDSHTCSEGLDMS